MIKREKYLAQIRNFYRSDLIKIITGVRRCGKSELLKQIIKELTTESDNIIFLDFEDRLTTEQIQKWQDIVHHVENNRKRGRCYVFMDEIQEINDWPYACKTLRLRDCSVFITGSNSKLLSGEFTKELSGRYVDFRIRPFVYKEILNYAEELGREISVSDYLIWGGFPKRLEFSKEEDLREASFNFFSNGIKVAAELGAPLLQVNTGWGYMNEPKEEVFKRMTEMFGRLCDIGEKFGINIACESLRPQESLAGATVRDIRKLYDILNHPRFKVMIDTCAMGVSGETIQDWFDAFPAEDIIHTHFQDGTPYFHLVYGDGKRSLNDDLKALYDNGYKGLISQELTLARYYQDPFEADKRSIAAFSEYLY